MRYFKWPDKLRLEMSVSMVIEEDVLKVPQGEEVLEIPIDKEEKLNLEILQIYDGNKAWVEENGRFRHDPLLSKKLSEVVRRSLHILLRYQDPGVDLRYVAQDSVKEKPVHVVEMIEGEKATTLYFSLDTGLLMGIHFSSKGSGQAEPIETKLLFSDFIEVGDVRMSRHIEEYRNGRKFGETRFSSISNEDEFPDSLFTPTELEPAAAE